MAGFNIPGDVALNADETDLVFVGGVTAIVQQARVGMQVFLGTWHYDRAKGFPWLQSVLVKNPDLRLIRTIFWKFLMTIPGVASVPALDLSFDPALRMLSVRYQLTTVAGESGSDGVELPFGEQP